MASFAGCGAMTRPRVLAIMPDLAEPAVSRDLGALRRSGVDVVTAAFRRDGQCEARPDLDLGPLPMGLGPRRLLALLQGRVRAGAIRRLMEGCDSVLARNLDMALLAVAAGAGTPGQPPLVYQCLDIHALVLRRDGLGMAARLAERRVLRRSARLVISSPAFVDAHFARYGPDLPEIALAENRIAFARARPPRPDPGAVAKPLRLGWVGSLRCRPTLSLLAATAARCGAGVRIRLHGGVHRHTLPEFDDVLAACPTMSWHGAYGYPDGLGPVYAGLDLVWAQDLWQRGGNSDWLLPNRIYEAGYFGVPVIAVAGTCTAAWVDRHRTGWVLPDATPEVLAEFLSCLDPDAVLARRRHILSLPASLFAAEPGDARILTAAPLTTGETHVATPAPA